MKNTESIDVPTIAALLPRDNDGHQFVCYADCCSGIPDTENERTLRATEAMRRGDAVELGRLMDASHASLRDDYQVSSDQLNAMVHCARQGDGCYGARMTGAGFGGCAVALVRAAAADAFAKAVAACYQGATGIIPAIYVCQATNGAELIRQERR